MLASTKTNAGLRVGAQLDRGKYPTKVEVTRADMERMNLRPHDYHGGWNYTITRSS